MKDTMSILDIPTKWKTVSYPDKSIGSAKISHIRYHEGYYMMEGVDGFLLYRVNTRGIPVTVLSIDGNEVMVDDPMHWLGMQRLAEHSSGNVLVCGLGLGLIVHHLCNNKNVARIDVAELNKDVISLVKPLLPRDSRVNVFHMDASSDVLLRKGYDTVIIDLLVKEGDDVVLAGSSADPSMVYVIKKRFEIENPDAKVFIWGIRDPYVNPAVTHVDEKVYASIVEMIEGRRIL